MSDVTVRVPASTANLGPGFDALGLALCLYNRIQVREISGAVRVTVEGEGTGILETGVDNLVYRAMARLYREVNQSPPVVQITLRNQIPVSRGLGSSSTAIVGGLVAANTLLGYPLDRERVLGLAVELEGHADNVTPALLGGFQVSSLDGTDLIHLRVGTPAGLRAVVCVPDRAVSTADARRVVPTQYSRADAVFNLGRVALLVAALQSNNPSALKTAMQDRIHQPYRASLIPGFDAVIRGALEAGAHGACLSGSGSTMLALATSDETAIGEAMVAAVRAAGADARWLALDVDEDGAVVEEA